jgi:hypothetical protein
LFENLVVGPVVRSKHRRDSETSVLQLDIRAYFLLDGRLYELMYSSVPVINSEVPATLNLGLFCRQRTDLLSACRSVAIYWLDSRNRLWFSPDRIVCIDNKYGMWRRKPPKEELNCGEASVERLLVELDTVIDMCVQDGTRAKLEVIYKILDEALPQ